MYTRLHTGNSEALSNEDRAWRDNELEKVTLGWALSTAAEALVGLLALHIRMSQFSCWLCCEFQFPATLHLGCNMVWLSTWTPIIPVGLNSWAWPWRGPALFSAASWRVSQWMQDLNFSVSFSFSPFFSLSISNKNKFYNLKGEVLLRKSQTRMVDLESKQKSINGLIENFQILDLKRMANQDIKIQIFIYLVWIRLHIES